MNFSMRRTRFFSSTAGKAVMVLAFASVIGGLSITPALADNNGRDGRGHWQRDHQREWHGDRDHHYGYQPEYRRPYYYARPVYVPPPVYYEPRQSPGISLFFPLDLRRR